MLQNVGPYERENPHVRDNPGIYADLVDGKHAHVTDATIAAGLKKPRTRLHELKNAWQNASVQERDEFTKWLLAQSGIKTPHPSTAGVKLPVAIDRRLQPWASSRIKTIMAMRNLQMGEKRLNTSIGHALHERRKEPSDRHEKSRFVFRLFYFNQRRLPFVKSNDVTWQADEH